MLRMRGVTTEEAMSLFESLFSDCSDIPSKSSSEKEISTDDLPVALSSGFQNADNVHNNSDKDLEEQSVPKVSKKRKVAMIVQNKSIQSRPHSECEVCNVFLCLNEKRYLCDFHRD
ncbi:hypothetical protein NPIL_394721 [Nephila pilipes]|uniref:Uncharacterized protein n=1 Tax=Nephila pilipes TaxID=299642 RepID=A0A8X6U8L7_NEPPI|nr:hypothetical protein NPIL_394721 [Nephila pilipes]